MAAVMVAPDLRRDWERGEGVVRVVLRSDVELVTAFAAMTAVSERVRSHEIEMWEPTALPFGVGLYVVMDPPQYDAVLDGLVAGLVELGISGSLTSHGPPVDDPPHPLAVERRAATTELIAGRVSVLGESSWPSPPYGWIVDDQVIDDVAATAVRWCCAGDAARAMHYGGADFAVVTDGGDAVQLLSLQLRDGSSRVCSVACVLPSGMVRQVDFAMSIGYVALISGSGGPMDAVWREHVDAVRVGVVEVAPFARYAMVRRGKTWRRLASADVLARDWVAMPHLSRPRRLSRALPLEDRRVPDAFGIQLLGPGHAAGTPSSDDWTRTPVARDRVLLERRDLAAWFSRPRPDEATLRAARDDLRPLLIDDSMLHAD